MPSVNYSNSLGGSQIGTAFRARGNSLTTSGLGVNLEPYSAHRMLNAHILNGFDTKYASQQIANQDCYNNTAYYQPFSNPSMINSNKDEFLTFGTCTTVRGEHTEHQAPLSSGHIGQTITLNVEEKDDSDLIEPVAMAAVEVAQKAAENQALYESEMNAMRTRMKALESEARQVPTLRRFVDNLHEENERLRRITEDTIDCRIEEPKEDEIEEIIEEEVKTVKRRPPPTTPKSHTPAPFIETLEKSVQQEMPTCKTQGVGDGDIVRHHVIDVLTPKIESYHFPPEYWSRLESEFTRDFLNRRPLRRDSSVHPMEIRRLDASTMAVPPPAPLQRCFGMSVRPVARDVGINCVQVVNYRDIGCLAEESDEDISLWLHQRTLACSPQQQKLIHDLVFAYKHDREKFVQQLIHILAKNVLSVGVDAYPLIAHAATSTGSEFLHSVGVSDDTIDVLVRQPPVVFNKAAHARPVMSSISCLTDRVATQEQASLTEAPITRSQASQASEEKRYTVEHGVSTDEPPTRVHRATDTEQQHTAQSSFGVQTPADLLDKFVSREAVEQANRILEEQWAHYRNGLVSTAVSTLPTPRLITVGVSTLLDKGNMISQAVDATDSNLLLSLFDRNIREYEGLRLNRQVAKAAQTTRSNAVNSLNSVSRRLMHIL